MVGPQGKEGNIGQQGPMGAPGSRGTSGDIGAEVRKKPGETLHETDVRSGIAFMWLQSSFEDDIKCCITY